MSLLGGNTRGRGRGRDGGLNSRNTTTNGAPTGPSRAREGRGGITARQPTRGLFGQSTRGGAGRGARDNGATPQSPGAVTFVGPLTKKNLEQRRTALREAREKEKKNAIRTGLMNDPDKSIKLSEAITMVATCQDMCPQFERVDRAYKHDIADMEKNPDPNIYGDGEIHMDEDRMVKSFKRSAAGDELPIPSDLRTPHTLQRTLDYLINDILGDDISTDHLGKVHGFLWDRTRAIRKDFSVQQLTKIDDLKIAIHCFERIARLHITYLHVLAVPGSVEKYSYSHQQEIEQLDKTLLSLMQYYDDVRGRLNCENEAEFRAYCVIFQLQDPSTPDLEDRVQNWPPHIAGHPRVQEALKIFAAACNTSDLQGPFPSGKTAQVIARQDWARFWDLIASNAVSYLMACVAEVYFNYVREMALKAIVGGSGGKPGNENTSWTLDSVWDIFNFDTEEQLDHFCSLFGMSLKTKDDGTQYLSFKSRIQPQRSGDVHQQKSKLVEDKRQGRSLPAVIDGLSIKAAKDAGKVVDDEEEDVDEEEMDDAVSAGEGEEESDEDTLFVSQQKEVKSEKIGLENGVAAPAATTSFLFGQPPETSSPFKSPFAQPSGGLSAFGKPTSAASPFAPKPATTAPSTATNESGRVSGAFGSQVGSTFMMPTNTTPLFPSSAAAPTNTPATQGLGITTSTTTSDAKTTSTGLFSGLGQTASGPRLSSQKVDTPTFSPKTSAASSGLFPFAAPATSAPEREQASIPSAQGTFNFGGFENATAKSQAHSEQSAKPVVPSFSFGQAAGGSSAAQTETNAKSQTQSQPQPHNTSPLTTSPPSQSAPEPSAPSFNPGSLSPSRRQSINAGQDTRPKRPSPLKESFTAENSEQVARPAAIKAPPREAGAPARTQSAAAELDAIVISLANELTFDPTAGLLKQYVDYTVRSIVTKAQEEVYFERITKEAEDYRKFSLSLKYFKKWRAEARARYLRRRGNESRARRRERLTKHLVEQGELDPSALEHSARSSRASSSRRPTARLQQPSQAEKIDAMFRSTNGGSRFQPQATAGSKRPAASLDGELMPPPSVPGHKRAKSSSHIDNHGRIAKPAPTSQPNADFLQRSSFLGYSAADRGETMPSTTKSNYFRLKAMGLSHQNQASIAQGTKRQRSESLDAASAKLEVSRARRLGSSSLRSSTSDRPLDMSLTRPSPCASVRSKANNEDEALFARLRAAREGLKECADFMRSERDEDFRRSRSASRSDHDSPSMERARSEARMRASLGASEPGASTVSHRDVPAYRLRESRFVPREHYGRAIERANEIRASRSQAGSRPESRTEQRPSDIIQPSKPEAAAPPRENSQATAKLPEPTTNGHTDFIEPFGSAAKPALPVQAPSSGIGIGFGAQMTSPGEAQPQQTQQTASRHPFSQTSSFTSANTSSQNPFLQVKAPAFGAPINTSADPFSQQAKPAFGSFGTNAIAQNSGCAAPAKQPTFSLASAQSFETGDHTIQPEQFPDALSTGFRHPEQKRPSPFAPTTNGSPTPPQMNSYMQSQATSAAISLLSDDEDEIVETSGSNVPNGQMEFFNQLENAAASDVDEAEPVPAQVATSSFEYAPPSVSRNAYANQFAALADYDEEEGAADEEEQDEDADQQYAEDDEEQEPDSYQHGDILDDNSFEDEESEDGLEMPNGGYNKAHYDEYSGEEELGGEVGDIEDYSEDGYDDEEEEDDGQEPLYANNHFSRANYRAMPKQQAPPVNAALQAVGNNNDDPIELDSD
ncbi:hypothetical protein AC578_6961 [Pseudocercospora eumusae]|uniref:SAC3/GANP/THP3 conserved domain-containing protein n=1 Tax=Pseudocercospora eumusae TaxID=321146 RepID=A0A139H9D5_9PEZI|nr:hypothetical protein AC578_6961 [Pseudocercospora eumusae]